MTPQFVCYSIRQVCLLVTLSFPLAPGLAKIESPKKSENRVVEVKDFARKGPPRPFEANPRSWGFIPTKSDRWPRSALGGGGKRESCQILIGLAKLRK